ncbi:dipeptidyl peptidase 4 [Lethenteron reissneri]|uniref:dipeptidyl peptidase 4 n=1 Tax=Lethenteron reissneri TaxID=7753 RepID=UPI002AB6CD70|nr:dipeptidyl peptidase 4 [Lethenteron reissneri]XP_061430526.1 dipeptidyl peptidase 4 [Lethenteron reissneri]
MNKVLRGVLVALAVAVVITLIVVLPLVILQSSDNPVDERKTFTLDDYFAGRYNPRSFGLEWITDDEYIYKDSNGNVQKKKVGGDPRPTEFISNSTFEEKQASGFLVAPDQLYVLLESNYSKLWRYSYYASYHIYDLQNTRFVEDSPLPHEIQYITWSPSGHNLAYVFESNVYLKTNLTGPAVKVTTSGAYSQVYNGIPDWVYEEEMLGSNNAMWWSPDGQHLAYAEFNDTEVPFIEYTFFGEEQYPKTIGVPYPKAGAPNPKVKLFVVSVADPDTRTQITAFPEIADRDHYLGMVTWATSDRLCVQWLSRHQNYSVLSLCDRDSINWTCSKNHIETSQTGWIGTFGPAEPHFAEDGRSYYRVYSNSDGFKHLHHVPEDSNPKQLTQGSWEVISIESVSATALYYISNEHKGFPGSRNLYRIQLDEPNTPAKCVSCTLDEERCQAFSTRFSKASTHYQLTCSGPGIPMSTLRTSTDDKEIALLENNTALAELIDHTQMPTLEQQKLMLGEHEAWYQFILPPNMDRKKKHPLIIDVYAGPGSQKVDSRFRNNWATYLASTERVIVASVDGRGSGYRGDKVLHQLYRRLGTVEVQDQEAAAREFGKMDFVDETRIAIWGWSYGGYVSSMSLGSGSGVFKCGMAVAPVSDWRYYDSIYTERYMGQPTKDDNLAAYESSTVMARAENFRKVDYLLIHGTADDNVHFQQAAHISKALVDKEVDFSAMWYTDKDHSISGLANHHVYTHMSHFLKQCFGLQ